jgi:hypothetical protein
MGRDRMSDQAERLARRLNAIPAAVKKADRKSVV